MELAWEEMKCVQWRRIADSDEKRREALHFSARRAKVPGGWLIAVATGGGESVTFYPDPKHEWDGNSLP